MWRSRERSADGSPMVLVAAFGLNALASFALGLLVARLLGPEEFGRFALGMAAAVALNNLAFEWLRLSATRYYSDATRARAPWIRAALDGAYGRLALGLAAGAILAALADAAFDLPGGAVPALAAASAAAAIGLGLFDYGTALARARFEGGLYARLVAFRTLAAVPLMAGAAATGRPTLVLAATALAALAAVALTARPLADPPAGTGGRAPALRGASLRRFAVYAGPLVAANVLYQLMPVANRGVLAAFDGFSQSGQFALAADVAGKLFQTLGSALDLILFQLAVRAEAREGRAAAEAQVAKNAALVAAILLPFAGGLYAVTPALEALVVPPAFRGAFAGYTALLIPGLLALSLASYALNPVFQLRGRTGPVIAAAVVGLLVDLAGLALLPPRLGAPGVAVAQGLGLAAALAVLAWRALTGPDRARLPWRDLGLAAGATLAMTLAVLPLGRLDAPLVALGASVGVGVAVYGVLAWLFDIAGLRGLAEGMIRRARPA